MMCEYRYQNGKLLSERTCEAPMRGLPDENVARFLYTTRIRRHDAARICLQRNQAVKRGRARAHQDIRCSGIPPHRRCLEACVADGRLRDGLGSTSHHTPNSADSPRGSTSCDSCGCHGQASTRQQATGPNILAQPSRHRATRCRSCQDTNNRVLFPAKCLRQDGTNDQLAHSSGDLVPIRRGRPATSVPPSCHAASS
jgi:hypothetical protein